MDVRATCTTSLVCYLQVVEDEEERFRGQPLVKLHGVRVRRWHLVVERQGGARVPHQVLPGKTQTEADQLRELVPLPVIIVLNKRKSTADRLLRDS